MHFLQLVLLALLSALATLPGFAQKDAPPDTIVFTNGDRLTGKLLREAAGSVVFHSDIAGDVTAKWDQIKELHSSRVFAVLEKGTKPDRKIGESQIPAGTLEASNGQIELEQSVMQAKIAPIPVADAAYIVDKATLDKQFLGNPGFFAAWNGSATGGVTVVNATQNQYTVTAASALERTVPTVEWLPPRNRTALNVNESFGKITEPSYTVPATATASATFVPSTYTKSNIFHGDAERDEYVSKTLYYLGQVSFDHKYAQSLQLQQLYGAGIGDTLLKGPKQELNVKATGEYERQEFFNSASINQELIAATVAVSYSATLLKGIVFHQQLVYVPAFNNVRAYSATETDAFTFPAYKSFGLTLSTLDSYLNDAPATLPLARRNSFQFVIGLTYTLKSKY